MATIPAHTTPKVPEPVLPENLESSEDYCNVLAMTQRMFPGPVGVRRKEDPEFPEEYLVFDVHAHGILEQVMARDLEWHRECRKLAPAASHLYRLALALDNESE